jgi:hypothetical protein
MNIQTGQEEIEETDAEFAIGLAALQRFVAREGHAQVPANHTEERITATERIPLSKFARFHTPGPWTVDEDRDSNRADDGSMQTIIDANDGDGWVTLAIMGGNFPESLEANARLLAAAPAMAQALGEFDETFTRWSADDATEKMRPEDWYEEFYRVWVIARAALAAARGEAVTPRVTATRKGEAS